ncbi:leucine--tRNA ligase [Flagellimonas halotolerans]|uniref:Leucine--tRNA ligase n=1 Tax=Flagellimonas halotolerans TaxID=3112164 RepID=A0ABU6INW0_9FLAO|nr:MULTISPECIES: class I tRNA ligase family protein [unclassified Allomuricauda]MEC3964842.1 class I tRNA ligase family protein [Muricauda sp. SYSU M86414]MEC4264794.1 class I tRNA ligase family protein [Muricauda sp. SYSU M84420]
MNYDFREIEAKWQKYWAVNETFKTSNDSDKPKFYALSMFPYPSGAGLHVGHPLGYIATDIYSRYKRHKGFNVLHPMGYDSFGLPAEQYAIQTGQHPAVTTENNIKRYREQLDQLGFSFDWSREVRTSNPQYYKWTQWIFIQLFNAWYNKKSDKAEHISKLISTFEKEGNANVEAACDDGTPSFGASDWNAYSEKEKQKILLKYRLTYLADTEVNWCPALGTVLANDEIVNGVSERGGHPVVRKKMTQWSMRITAYAQRLLDGLDKIDWPQPLKDAQTNWIGRSVGASVTFNVISSDSEESQDTIEVFTTRPDTIFGVSFMTLAPEHELVAKITTPEQKAEVDAYVEATAKRSERDRMADVKTISGVFTGAYAEHPFTKEPIPIWIGDYVLASYGTGAVMAVPCGDQRDYDFAKHYNIDIPNIFEGVDISEEAFADKETTVIANSDFLNGLPYKEAMRKIIAELEKIGHGKGKVNYRLRDAVFSRQRYWGEPFPVYYVDGMPQMIDEKYLPLELPEVEKYLPTETGEPPLGNATEWAWDTVRNKVVSNENLSPSEGDREGEQTVFPLELNTMPGWAGSSQYFNRYMDPRNDDAIFSPEAINYWQDVDLYIGGSEHATGHLLYSRFWQKFMFDMGYVPKDEFAQKLINQGMITGTSAFVYFTYYSILEKGGTGKVLADKKFIFISKELYKKSLYESDEDLIRLVKSYIDSELLNKIENDELILITPLNSVHADVSLVNASDELDVEGFKQWQPEYKDAEFILEDGKYIVGREVEKMSKSKYNVVNPDAICEEYGADSLRLYEMFLGPLEQSKPWNTAGITGVHSFLKKLWKLYSPLEGGEGGVEPTAENLKTLHKTIKKVEEDIENFSFNTSVSTFMICVNELTSQKCTSKAILEPLAILVSPYAPHIAEELWERLGNTTSIAEAPFPRFEEKYLVESSKEYPISFNGKMRFKLELPLDMGKDEIEAAVLANEKTQAQLEGRTPKKVIVVPGKIVNIVG